MFYSKIILVIPTLPTHGAEKVLLWSKFYKVWLVLIEGLDFLDIYILIIDNIYYKPYA